MLKNYENSCRRRSSKKDDPPRAIFNDFRSILEVPGDPEIIKKQSKERYKKEVEKRVLGHTGPERTGRGS